MRTEFAQGLWNPIAISVWIAGALAMITIFNWWPDGSVHFVGYLRPLPAIAAVLVAVILFIDWYALPTSSQILSTDVLAQEQS